MDDPKAIIETYVDDVVHRLPRRQRHDVGYELRSLLNEDLDGRAADSGRPADAAMALQLLTAFGRPQDVADRYRPAGFTVIRPADAPRFAWLALGGLALQWAITLADAFTGPVPTDGWVYADSWWGRLTTWWLSWGLGSFWWPGFLITLTLVSAALGQRRRAPKPWTPRRTLDRDHVNRPAIVLGLAFGALGATLMIALPWLAVWAPGLPQPLLDAFAFDPRFLQVRAVWALPLWAAGFAVLAMVLVAGRWDRRTRRISLVLDLGWLVLLGWWLAAGRIFVAEAADGAAKLGLLLVVVFVVVDIVVTVRRTSALIRPPVVQA
ncbi:hypothetical protein [Catellatospora citrea]|uniref:Uncharacterized protein n=1 Tax=Catellatospora citrea TaxID=53366 RepID=A0A8J3NX52_9ACTN|nr:hypothetical protein [Catellatospora citrea]RKE12707.1 hypothetical protein C8E86_7650 [Catellatospora citrea]GIF96055.1 hypothetical protein Cci01nite_11490 [Catellatospora citrea]